MSSEQAETAPPKPDRGESVELFDYGQLRDYAGFMLRSPGRHGFLAVASFLVVVGLAGAASMLLPDAYQSRATILARAPVARSRRPPRRDRLPAARPPAPGERERPRRSHWLASTVAARAPHWPAASTRASANGMDVKPPVGTTASEVRLRLASVTHSCRSERLLPPERSASGPSFEGSRSPALRLCDAEGRHLAVLTATRHRCPPFESGTSALQPLVTEASWPRGTARRRNGADMRPHRS